MNPDEARILLMEPHLLEAYARQKGFKVQTVRQIAWNVCFHQGINQFKKICRRNRVAY